MTITDKPTLQIMEGIFVAHKNYLQIVRGNVPWPFSNTLVWSNQMAETDRLLNMVRQEINNNCVSSAGEQLRPMPGANG